MSDNFYANWTPSADDEEQRKLRAWQALAGDQAPHRTMANQVQLPEMDVSTPNIASGRGSDFGAMVPGNIDLSQRPHVRNADGSTSTVYSMGANIDDKEMLLPGVNDLGYVMTPDQAIEEYRRTGKNLGQYASPAASDAAGEAIHQQQMRQPPEDTLRGRGGPGYDMTPPDPSIADKSADEVDMSVQPPSATARMGAMLSGRDAAPAPPESLPRDEPRSSGNDASPWAVLADVLLNKGRGVGGILAMGASGKSDMRRAELDLKRAQAEHLRNPTTDPASLAYKEAMLELQREREKRLIDQGGTRADLTRTNIENTQKRFDTHRMDVTDPNSQFNQTQVSQAGARAGASAQGRIGAEHELNDVVTGDKAQVAGAEAAARIGAGHDLSPMTTADEAAKARAVGYAGNEPKLDYEEKMNPILGARATNGFGGIDVAHFTTDNPGLHLNDNGEQLGRIMKMRGGVPAKVLEQLQSARGAPDIVDRLHDTAREYQKLLTDGQGLSGRAAALRRQYAGHTAEYASVLMAMTDKTEGSRKEYEGLVPDLHNPQAIEGIAGLWGPLEQNINRNLGTLGIGADKPRYLRQQQQPTDADGGAAAPSINATNPTPSASPARGDYANYSRDTSDPPSLGKAPVPKIPTDAQRGTNVSPRKVTKPDGTMVVENLSDEEAATLNARPKWRVE